MRKFDAKSIGVAEKNETYIAMKNETPLLQFEMTKKEIAFALQANRHTTKTIMKRRGLILILIALAYCFFLGVKEYFYVDPAARDFSFLIILPGTGLFVMLLWIIRHQVRKVDPLVYLSKSGLYFMGSLYSFHPTDPSIEAALVLEASDGEPAVLRLTLDGSPSWINFEIPLRPEMMADMDKIVSTLTTPSQTNPQDVL